MEDIFQGKFETNRVIAEVIVKVGEILMDMVEITRNGYLFLRKCFRDMADRHCEEEVASAVAFQKEEDVCSAIAAFLELKTSEGEIMRLLSKFYGVDSTSKAIELISTVRVTNQVKALREHLHELGMSGNEISDYLRKHRVREQLRADLKLQNMAVDKLKSYFDKH